MNKSEKNSKVNELLQDPHIALLVRQIENLMSEHQRLVAEGKAPAYKLMGLHKDTK